MATNQPQNLLEWQLHCVLKRASLLQYYDSFVRQGECNVLQLFESDNDKFKDVMEKVGMAKKSIHVRQFKNSLLEWVKDPGKDTHVPSYISKADISTMSPAPSASRPDTVSLSQSEKSSVVHNLPLPQRKDTQEQEGMTRIKSEKILVNLKKETTQKQTQRKYKDQEHRDLTGYYDELLDNTVLDKLVLDNLISRCIIMIEDREEIIKPTTQRERNKVLLDILNDRPYPTFHLFKDVLQESDPNNSCIQELVKKMMSTESRDENISFQGHNIVLNKPKVKLQKNYMMFVHGVDSNTDIADHLYQSDVLSTEEKEEICNSSLTQQESNRLLYNKLIRKGGDAYTHLLDAVLHGEYPDVASEMEKTELSDQEIQLCQIGMKKLKDRHEKKDILMDHDEVIPKHILDDKEYMLIVYCLISSSKYFLNVQEE